MGYRDDREAMAEQIVRLETDLAEANETIAKLKGQEPGLPPTGEPQEDESTLFAGMGDRFRGERVLPFVLTEKGFEAIADYWRTQSIANVSQVGHQLHATTKDSILRVTQSSEGTRVLVEHDDTKMRSSIVAFALMATLFVTVAFGGVLADTRLVHPLGAAFVAPLVLVAAFRLFRRFARTAHAKERARMRGILEATVALAADHPHARIVSEPEPLEAEQEPEAGETARVGR